MNHLPSRDELKQLSEKRGPWCVSIYMPTARRGKETLQGPVRLKNLLRQAEEKLQKLGAEPQQIADLLHETRDLVDNYDFFQHQSDGLAILVSEKETRTYRLPLHLEEDVHVNDRLHLKPLMQVMTNNGRYFLLAASQRSVRFFEGTRFSLTELELPDRIPRTLEEAMKYEDWGRAHHFSPGSQGRQAGGIQAFGGHGVDASDKENLKADVLQFFQMVDKGVFELIGADSAPLIFAGLDYLHPVYRDANTYSHFVEEAGIFRAVDDLRPDELHELSWQAIEPVFRKEQEVALERFNTLRNKGLASSDLHEVVPAAVDGRVEALLVPVNEHRWGVFEPDTHQVELRADETAARGEDLIDLAAVSTFVNGGAVFAVGQEELPDHAPVAAVFRY